METTLDKNIASTFKVSRVKILAIRMVLIYFGGFNLIIAFFKIVILNVKL